MLQNIKIFALSISLLITSMASAQCDNIATIVFATDIWGQEVSWTLVDELGDVIASGDGYNSSDAQTLDVCLGTGCHTLHMIDSFGDGWNGAVWSMIIDDATVIGPFTLVAGTLGIVDVPVGENCEVLDFGCTDSEALNYQPEATEDDGSCVYASDCDGCDESVVDPVCALNINSGEILTYASACLALCEGAILLEDWDCGTATGGCTDPEASNYNGWAAYDDGSCVYPCGEDFNPATFYLCTFSNGEEVGLDIVHESGDTLYSQAGFNNVAIVYEDFCLESGCYTATLSNVAGNTGWYGGYFSINGGGIYASNITLSSDNTSATYVFSTDGSCESISGCTNVESPNFNPEATYDDGSCLPSCNCDDAAYEPVCVWDWNGTYITLNNACEAACLGYSISYFDDCVNAPVYGCTDETALNYNPEANVDQNCLYAPVCGADEIAINIELISSTESLDFVSAYFSLYNTTDPYPFVIQYDLDGAMYGVGCAQPGCYNFIVYETWSGSEVTALATADGITTTFVLEEDQFSASFGWGIGIDVPCEFTLPGCTDPEAENYNPSATEDDGSCTYPLTCDDGLFGTLYVCTFSNGDAVALTIETSEGTTVYDQQGYSNMAIMYTELCIDPEECYTVTMSNISGGVGWYGGYYWLDVEGIQIAGGSLSDFSTEETSNFGWFGACEETEEVLGCTDPAANNFDELATVDDGSCVYPSACPLGQEIDITVFAPIDAWVELTDAAGNVIVDEAIQSGWYANVCLEDGCYNFRLESVDGSSLLGAFASMFMEDGSGVFMDVDDTPIMEEAFGLGTDCGTDFDGFGGSPWEFDETIAFTPYPNPTENVINVAGGGWDHNFPIDVTVRDLTGKVVYLKQIPAGGMPRILVEGWPAGMYLMDIQQGYETGRATFMKLN